MTSKPTEVRYIYTFPLENEISSWKHVKCYKFYKNRLYFTIVLNITDTVFL